jgi:hypothetical protein
MIRPQTYLNWRLKSLASEMFSTEPREGTCGDRSEPSPSLQACQWWYALTAQTKEKRKENQIQDTYEVRLWPLSLPCRVMDMPAGTLRCAGPSLHNTEAGTHSKWVRALPASQMHTLTEGFHPLHVFLRWGHEGKPIPIRCR